jgi:hypothetical protein
MAASPAAAAATGLSLGSSSSLKRLLRFNTAAVAPVAVPGRAGGWRARRRPSTNKRPANDGEEREGGRKQLIFRPSVRQPVAQVSSLTIEVEW